MPMETVATKRKRMCCRTRPVVVRGRGTSQICVPMDRELCDRIWDDAGAVRRMLEGLIAQSPELFPAGIEQGFVLSGRLPESKKMPGVRLRQLRLKTGTRAVFSLRPSFVSTYMTGDVEELDKPLFLLSLGVPVWVVVYCYGRDEMYWHRHLERLGRNSVVGTTVRAADRLPEHLAADEHHVKWAGTKGDIATTTGGGCVLGVALADAADDASCHAAYADFCHEARDIAPQYSPRSVSTDGWKPTQNAFTALFETVIILCFLHGFLKVRDRARKDHELHQQIWHVYRAESAADFQARMTGLRTWCDSQPLKPAVREVVQKLFNHTDAYAVAYAHPGCHRTSNAVDRPMNRMHRLVYAGRGLHGHQQTSQRRLRGWALLHNFRHDAPRSGTNRTHLSPAHRLNHKRDHDHWLHNLNASASLAGFRSRT